MDNKIKRGNVGKNPTRHGIILQGLKPRYRNVLKKYEFIKEDCNDDVFVNLLFSLVDRETNAWNLQKVQFPESKHQIQMQKIFCEEQERQEVF